MAIINTAKGLRYTLTLLDSELKIKENSDVKERLTINGTTEIEIIDVHPNHYRVKQLRVYYFDDKQLKTRTPMNEIDYHYGTYFEKDPNIILNDFLKDHIYLRKQTNN